MRTLLIDNHDSFTFNLFHQLAQVNGREPVVVANDDPRFRMSDLRRFDSVVISPGPGRPDNPADFGLCRAVIDHGDLPLLGVCLGHQGLCLAHGATVGRVTPRHGVVDRVRHTGVDLFAGLPQPLPVVRYHSLAVTDLPPSLEAVAWSASDDVLMGVRDRTRPAWGVQFHPESICTSSGHLLLANFRDLAGGSAGAADPLPPPAAEPAPERRVTVRRVPVHPPPERVFAELYGASTDAFWLDSSQTGDRGRFSVMGDAGGPLARVAKYDVSTGRVTVGDEEFAGPFLDWVARDLAANRVAVPDVPFEFHLGWVGYLGYELKAECGGEFAHRSEQPDAAFVFADRALVFDHLERSVHLLTLTDSDGWLDRTEALLTRVGDGPAEPVSGVAAQSVVLRHNRAQYLKLVAACQEAITAGETYEVCLTNEVAWRGALDPWQAYRFLRAESPAPFGALLRFDALSVLSTSPERFIRIDREGVVESEPIKGTRPRGATPAADRALRTALATSAKDRAENLMIVDLVRNDLGHCAEVGSVEVPRIFEVASYATVHQLVSTVRARLRPGASAVSAVRAAFPGGSMTGAPKIRTMQIIDGLEAGPRGVYSGALGYFSLSGTADFSIVIRTLVVDRDKVSFGVGGAVIALSDPAGEFEETAVKATALLSLLGAGFPGRE
ncbi:aminodeoxychorismate synthase component I [Actinosynnema sp. NPDC047251]|uniref:aminodeoxychorismate synthase n=1 Tax=Saccharothrix espanaensis (strain ATCC 51144 / DSM 44229 / JCM 9112 / NBRC 15066 / NRRL 15764) TaxID=1179773 RepID=K0KB17_SACES|nr:aminodeoxychorismate synthase component I [Saccharothrix espanaensis]CCH34009.1 para-aminobenzoate synthase [Saccharothrix espanaensis DSM 44229]